MYRKLTYLQLNSPSHRNQSTEFFTNQFTVFYMVRIDLSYVTLTSVTAWKVVVFGIFLVHIFPHLDWIRKDTEYLSVINPNAGKYGPEKLRVRTLFTPWVFQIGHLTIWFKSYTSLKLSKYQNEEHATFSLWISHWNVDLWYNHLLPLFLLHVFLYLLVYLSTSSTTICR